MDTQNTHCGYSRHTLWIHRTQAVDTQDTHTHTHRTLDTCSAHSGFTLRICWAYNWQIPGICWAYSRHILGRYWAYSGHISGTLTRYIPSRCQIKHFNGTGSSLINIASDNRKIIRPKSFFNVSTMHQLPFGERL